MPTLEELHAFAVERGREADPRSEEALDRVLEQRREAYEDAEGVRRARFDEDRLDNPYDDSKVLHGGDANVDTVAVGIDMGTQELLLVDRLNERGAGIDGVVAHHPEGRALARLAGVMELNVDTLHDAGIPVSQAEGVVREAFGRVRQKMHAVNHPRVPQAAERLDLPLMTLHTVTDNFAYRFTRDYVTEAEPQLLADLVDALLDIPEYGWALEHGVEPEVFAGQPEARAGKIGVLGFTGGTDVGADLIETMVDAGVDTLLAMHATLEEIEAATEHSINVVSAGHMAADSLGMNLLLDELQDEFSINVEALSGFTRVER